MKYRIPNALVFGLVIAVAHLSTGLVTAAVATNGQVIISEFRLRGANGANDEFVEIYNNTPSNIVVATLDGSAGWALVASDGMRRFVIPNGTVLPARGHFLGINSMGYALASYPAGSGATATGNVSYAMDIQDNDGIALFRTTNSANFVLSNRLDAVGSTAEANTLYKEGTGYPALTPFSIDCAFYRNLTNGAPRDTDNNANDFLFVDSNGTSAGAGQRLGAAGPENLSSPIRLPGGTNGVRFFLLDSNTPYTDSPNYVRDFTSSPPNNSTFGTISIRRRIMNNTPNPITRLRFRATDLTTFPSPPGITDLRPRTSTNVVVAVPGIGNVTVYGTVLEQPPSQPNGGGFNSTFSVTNVTPGAPLAPGASIYVQFLLGLQQEGLVRFRVLGESTPGGTNDILILENVDDEGVEASEPRIWTGLGANNFWNTAANWSNNLLPVAGSPLVFPAGAARLVNSNNFTAGTIFSSITFAGTSGGYDLRGNSLALGAGGIAGLHTSGTNIISLPITVAASRSVNVVSSSTVVLSGVVSGVGGLNKLGVGTLVLAGSAANTFGGNLWARVGTTLLAKSFGVDAVGGFIIVGDGSGSDTLRLASGNQIPDSSGISINNGLFDLNGFNETLGSITMTAGRLVSGAAGNAVYIQGNITTTAASQSSRLEGNFILDGGGTCIFSVADGSATDDLVVLSPLASAGGTGLNKAGAGRMIIETNCTYIGNTTVSAGTLVMNGANLATDVLLNGGTFAGLGSVGGVSGGSGILSPGESPGIMTATNLQLLAGSTFAVEIYGTLVGSEYDRLNVNGPVTLGGSLSVTLGAGASQVGNVFRIINNDGVDAINGTFAGLPEGATVIIGGYRFRISYVGGVNANDVTLTRLAHVNITPNNIPTSGEADVYPSVINISGMTGLVSRVTVTLSNFSHTYPDDVDVLLESPSGRKVLLMSDMGGLTDAVSLDLTIADAAGAYMPDSGPLVSGTYRPSNSGVPDFFPVPAPAGPYSTNLFTLVGDSPNGAWSLYVTDDTAGDGGSLAGGWSIDITVGPPLEITPLPGSRVMLSWPDYAVGFDVEAAPHVTNAVWTSLGITPILTGTEFRVTNTMNPTNLFYRLVK